MSKIQLDRLRNDLAELTLYMEKVKRQNNIDLLSKLTRKRDFLQESLNSKMELVS